MSAVTISQMADRVSLLLEERLSVRGHSFEEKVRKAGRRLPRKVRDAATFLAAAGEMAQNPKLLAQLDQSKVAAAYDICLRHLGGLRRAGGSAWLSAAASAAMGVFVVMLLMMAVVYWRGLI